MASGLPQPAQSRVIEPLQKLSKALRSPHDALESHATGVDHGRRLLAFAVAALVFALLFPFVDQNYLVNYQFDTHIFARHVAQFRMALATGTLSALPVLEVWPSYFDAYDVLLTVLTAATDLIGRVAPQVRQALPTIEVQTNFWARWMSLGFHAVGMAFLWLALMRVYARPFVALGLTMIVALSPTIISMDLGRNDWGVLGSLSAVLYFCTCCAQGDLRKGVLIGLGVAAALLVTMKLNGPAFGVFVVFALIAIMVYYGADWGRTGIVLATFVMCVALLSIRLLYYSADVVPNVMAQFNDLRQWATAYPKPTLFYYSWDVLQDHGAVYRRLIWVSVSVVAIALTVRPSLTGLFVFGSFCFFVAWSVVVDYGFDRGGYHLLPLFVMMIALAFAQGERLLRMATDRRRLVWAASGAGIAVLLAEPLLVVGRSYSLQAAEMFGRPTAVHVTRTLPAQWMASTFPKGTRIATIHTTDVAWIPPIHDLGFEFVDSLLTAPSELLNREPPAVSELRSVADVVIVSDHQEVWTLWNLERIGEHDRAARWRQWFEALRRSVPSVVFSSESPGYYYRTLEVFTLDPASNAAALRASLAAVEDPVTARGPLDSESPEGRALLELAAARAHWEVETHEGSTATLLHSPTTQGEMRVRITTLTGQVPWYVKVNQATFEMANGGRYVLSFRARANGPRRIACAVGQNGPPWQPLGLYQIVDVTTEWTTHEFSFVASATESNARVYFDLGFSDVAVDLADVTLRDAAAGQALTPR